MRIPAEDLVAATLLGIICAPDGTVTAWPAPSPFELPGFLPWDAMQVGNGDVYGYYWPIGRETEPPIVCTTYHDDGTLVPIASSLRHAVRIVWAKDAEDDEAAALAKVLHVKPPDEELEDDDPFAALEIDRDSPQYLTAAADALTKQQGAQEDDLKRAQRYYLKALARLPEYGLASYGLGRLYRRRRDMRSAIAAMLDTAIAPACFGGDRSACLQWLRRLPDDAFFESANPLWEIRKSLTPAPEVTQQDIPLYESLIEAYLNSGDGVRAIRLRMLIGEPRTAQTTPLRRSAEFSGERAFAALAADLRRAGMEIRLPALGL
jgi:hypothetical protein